VPNSTKFSIIIGTTIGVGFFIVMIVMFGNTAKTAVLPPQETNNTGNSNIALSPDDCQKRFFIPTPGGKFHSCPGIATSYAAITDASGFPACVQMYDSDPRSISPTTYDFVLKPNSTGYLTLVYDFGSNEVLPKEYFADITKSDIYRLSDDGNSLQYLAENQTSISAFVALENITYTGVKTVKLTYTVETKFTKPEEVGHTYYFSVYEACEGEFVTIGEKPYSGRLPWD
jgi:hypothetical protein